MDECRPIVIPVIQPPMISPRAGPLPFPGGNAANGRKVFVQHCTACHKVGGEGQDYGPVMDQDVDGKGPVGKRLTRASSAAAPAT